MADVSFRERDFDCPKAGAERAALLRPISDLEREIERGLLEVARLKAVDAILGGYSQERGRIMDRIVPMITARTKRLRDLAEAVRAAKGAAEVERASGGRRGTPCVFVTCRESGERVGPIWGHGEKSVFRALYGLDEACGCGAPRHRGFTAEELAALPAPVDHDDEHEPPVEDDTEAAEAEADDLLETAGWVVDGSLTDDEVVDGSLTDGEPP